MLKKTFLMLLACAAVLPFTGGQLVAAPQDPNMKTEDVAWWHGGWGGWHGGGWGWNRGWGGGWNYPFYNYGYRPYYWNYNYPYYYNNPWLYT